MTDNSILRLFIEQVPKAELHIHLEGSIEPETQFMLAKRNGIDIKYNSVQELNKAYNFADLRDFLRIYYQGTRLLRTEQDFYDITKEYLRKAASQNIRHVELSIDFQTYEKRRITTEEIMSGIRSAINEAHNESGISCYLILAFLRHLGPESAIKTLKNSLRFRDEITAVGLAATEIGYPPELFVELYDMARKEGFRTTAHAGEEGPASYVKGSIDYLKVERIDHGNKAMDDPGLITELIDKQIPLTLCPFSNVALKNVPSIKDHTLKKKLDMGLMVSVNSDDPAYFGGYVNENLLAVAEGLDMDISDIRKLAENSFLSSFLPESQKRAFIGQIDDLYKDFATGNPAAGIEVDNKIHSQ